MTLNYLCVLENIPTVHNISKSNRAISSTIIQIPLLFLYFILLLMPPEGSSIEADFKFLWMTLWSNFSVSAIRKFCHLLTLGFLIICLLFFLSIVGHFECSQKQNFDASKLHILFRKRLAVMISKSSHRQYIVSRECPISAVLKCCRATTHLSFLHWHHNLKHASEMPLDATGFHKTRSNPEFIFRGIPRPTKVSDGCPRPRVTCESF